MNLKDLRQTHFPRPGKVSSLAGWMGVLTTVFLDNIHVQVGWRQLFDLTLKPKGEQTSLLLP